jgi:hypothetical protein
MKIINSYNPALYCLGFKYIFFLGEYIFYETEMGVTLSYVVKTCKRSGTIEASCTTGN